MSTFKDEMDKLGRKIDHSTRELVGDAKHQVNDHEEDTYKEVKAEEAEKGTLWSQLKEGAKEVAAEAKEQLSGEDAPESDM